MDPKQQSPSNSFTAHHSISSFSVPVQAYLSARPKEPPFYSYLAVGALVFDSSSPARILLIQRAATDSMPNRYETAGGGCDDEDPTILHSVARELWEETGLTAARIGPQIGTGHLFLSRSGKVVCKFNFLVEAQRGSDGGFNVKLDPNEHQSYLWAAEDEVKAERAGDIELKFTTKGQKAIILDAFETAKKLSVQPEDRAAD